MRLQSLHKAGLFSNFYCPRTRTGKSIWAVFGTVKGVKGSWTRARRVVWFIALVYDSFATGAPRTLISDLGRKKKELNHRSELLIYWPSLVTTITHTSTSNEKLPKGSGSCSEWQNEEFVISGDHGIQPLPPPGRDVPAQVVLAPNAPCWRETTGQTQSGRVGIFPASSPHSSFPTVILTWIND